MYRERDELRNNARQLLGIGLVVMLAVVSVGIASQCVPDWVSYTATIEYKEYTYHGHFRYGLWKACAAVTSDNPNDQDVSVCSSTESGSVSAIDLVKGGCVTGLIFGFLGLIASICAPSRWLEEKTTLKCLSFACAFQVGQGIAMMVAVIRFHFFSSEIPSELRAQYRNVFSVSSQISSGQYGAGFYLAISASVLSIVAALLMYRVWDHRRSPASYGRVSTDLEGSSDRQVLVSRMQNV